MDIFQYRDRIIDDYRAFTRSFTQIKATDIQQFVAGHHDSGHYWPAPHIQLNPAFVYTKTVEELAAEGTLHPACAEIFRFGRKPASIGDSARLFHHQYEAIKAAQRQASYVLTTGTGSGKSLSYIIPIVDHVLRTKRNDAPSIKAIIIYPMNALVNSQLEELDKFFGHYGEQPPVTYGRYTGQESQEERQAMAASPPDIILTNFMMLELLMTRQDELDRTVMKAAKGLNFLVLDELHTYRGRQGADVAMLVRRVREALNPSVQCVGTSATMASEGSRESCAKVVADVASKLFGAPVEPENIITERLERQTSAPGKPSQQILSEAIQAGLPDHLDFNALREHPVSSWIELTLGLVKEEGDWVRAKPCTLQQAAQKLADDAELDPETCELYLRDFLIIAYRCKDAEGKTLFAFRLHQFLSGANTLYSTLEPESKRQLDLSGQVFKPGSDKHQRFYSVHFCRQCGQEYYPVWRIEEGGETRLLPRDIDDRSTDEEDGVDFGFYIFDSKQGWNDEDPENYPENWLELKNGDYRIKQNFKKHKPLRTYVLADGRCSRDGEHGWFIPGSFRFCLSCGTAYAARGKDGIRLTGLSGEGRSSASTILTISALRHLLERESELANDAKKLLGFTDNRQDAALQAGHFNDFIQVLLLRSALLAAVSTADEGYLTDSIIAQRVFERLGFHVSGDDYLDNPDAKGPGRRRAEETMRSVLGYRLYFDLRRGWRYNNPNLEQLGLLEIDYEGLKDLCADEDEWRDLPFPALSQVAPNNRFTALKAVLDTMRRGLCIKSRYLETQHQEQIRNQSFQYLKEPWGFTEDEQLQEGCYLITGSKAKYSRYLNTLVTGSARSLLGTLLKRASTWGDDATLMGQIKEKDYPALIDSLLKALQSYGLIEPENLDKELVGYQLLGEFLQWRAAPEAEQNTPKPQQPYAVDNTYFRALYRSVAALLEAQNRTFFELEAREHTAQVEPEQRELRESRFRWQTKDQERYASEGQLRTLFCSPTMELGVDIASLNSVYLRNVPPTPANYAQRSGRAGRSGQPALVLTYCAARSPHDQYFFQDPVRMIHGQVSPPSLDLANEDLIASHLHAIWLNETRQALPRTVNGMLDMQQPDEMPLLDEYAIPMDDAKVLKRTAERGRNLLKMLQDDLQAAQGI
jgi:superfamily II DNA/RNA helicase